VTSQLDSSLWETWRAALDTLTDSWIWMDDARYSRLIMLLRIYSCWPGMLIDIRACLLILIVQTAPHFCFDCLWSKQGQSVNSLAPLLQNCLWCCSLTTKRRLPSHYFWYQNHPRWGEKFRSCKTSGIMAKANR
jgi:hypothetical protein